MNLQKQVMDLSGFQLKLIASVSMLADHIGAVCFPDVQVLRMIGRLALPIYCFLLAQGFIYTKHLKKYMARVGGFALLSEVPFDLARTGQWLEFGRQNIFFTLFLGLCCMAVCKWAEEKRWYVLEAAAVIPFCLLGYFLRTDYDWYGVLLIMIFYTLRNMREVCYMGIIAATGLYCVLQWYWPQLLCLAALVMIYFYNGQRGKFRLRYGFYAFYPAHLLALYGLSLIIGSTAG